MLTLQYLKTLLHLHIEGDIRNIGGCISVYIGYGDPVTRSLDGQGKVRGSRLLYQGLMNRDLDFFSD